MFGSTLGAIVQSLTPAIAQIAILILVFSFFLYKFIQKFRNAWAAGKKEEASFQESLLEQEAREEEEEEGGEK